jgi:hypothetical protein
MSAANPNPMEKSMVSMLVVANAGGGSPLPCGVLHWWRYKFSFVVEEIKVEKWLT